MKLPIRHFGLLAAGLLLGSALAPVSAQGQQSGVDGQVAVRSDGAVYLISGGQRRWVATVVISDDEINAYPEGEPIYVGLAPMGSSGSQASSKPSNNSSNNTQIQVSASPAANPGSSNNSSSSNRAAAPTSTPDPNLSGDIPIDVDIVDDHGKAQFEAGESFQVQIKTKSNVACQLTARFPNGQEAAEDSQIAKTDGKCRFTIEIPNGTPDGDSVLIGEVREGGKVNKQEVPFSVTK